MMLNITMRHKYLNGTSKTRVIQHPLFLESEKMHITTEVFVIIKSVIRTFFALKTCISKLSNRPFATYCKRPKITRQLNKALIVVIFAIVGNSVNAVEVTYSSIRLNAFNSKEGSKNSLHVTFCIYDMVVDGTKNFGKNCARAKVEKNQMKKRTAI